MDICIPGKLFEYAVSNKPLVMGSSGEAKSLIEKYKLGIAVKPSSVEDFKDAFIKLSHKDYVHKPNLSLFIQNFSLNNISKNYKNIFSNLEKKKYDKKTKTTNYRRDWFFWKCCIKKIHGRVEL